MIVYSILTNHKYSEEVQVFAKKKEQEDAMHSILKDVWSKEHDGEMPEDVWDALSVYNQSGPEYFITPEEHTLNI